MSRLAWKVPYQALLRMRRRWHFHIVECRLHRDVSQPPPRRHILYIVRRERNHCLKWYGDQCLPQHRRLQTHNQTMCSMGSNSCLDLKWRVSEIFFFQICQWMEPDGRIGLNIATWVTRTDIALTTYCYDARKWALHKFAQLRVTIEVPLLSHPLIFQNNHFWSICEHLYYNWFVGRCFARQYEAYIFSAIYTSVYI